MKVGFQHMGTVNIALTAFIESMGCDVVRGPAPNKKTLNIGVKHAPELVCLPFKITLGDMFGVLERGADTLLFIGGGNWSCRFGYYGRVQCSLLRKLGYRFNSIFVSGENLKPVASEILKLNNNSWTRAIRCFLHAFTSAWYKSRLVDLAEELARKTRPVEIHTGESSRLLQQFLNVIEKEDSIQRLRRMRPRVEEAFAGIKHNTTSKPLRIQLVGESYCVIEPFVNFNIIEYLGNKGVIVEPFLTAHRWLYYHTIRKDEDRNYSKKKAKKLARPYWAYGTGGEDQVSIGYAIKAAQQGYDGIIHLMPFGCMPETAALPVFEKISKSYDVPFLNISLDEHTGSTGIYTRIGAFVDILTWRRTKFSNSKRG